MTVGMIASPSRPSVRFTALEMPTTKKVPRSTKPTAPSGIATDLKNGTMSSVCCGSFAL